MSVTLRNYQEIAISMVEEALPNGPTLLVVPTGGGKTVCASRIIHDRVRKLGQRPVFLAPRREIVYQTRDKLEEFLLDTGVIMAGHTHSKKAEVQVASVDTLRSWIKRGKLDLKPRDLLIVDEAAHSTSATFRNLIDTYLDAGAHVLGMTATPIRSDGVGLGQVYTQLLQPTSVTKLIGEGFLCPVEYRVPYVPELSKVKTRGGDFAQEQLAEIMDRNELVGEAVTQWLRHAKGRPTIAFASGVRHSMHIADAFNAAGVPAQHIDGETAPEVRDRAVTALRDGSLMVLTNHSVFSEGTDIPCVSCIQDMQPTKSLGRHIQKLGRGMRTYPGKENLMVLDHAGNYYRHGRIDRDIQWTLCEGKEIVEREAKQREKTVVEFTCSECFTVFSGQTYCPACGTKVRMMGKAKDFKDEDLVSLTKEEFDNIENIITEADKIRFYRELLGWARETKNGQPRRKDGWAAYMFKEKFGDFPPFNWRGKGGSDPTQETRAWIQSRLIRASFAKKKEAA